MFSCSCPPGDLTTSFAAMRSASASLPPARDAVFVLALFGFGTKAGSSRCTSGCRWRIPVAPSHVSALMSGVMIKMGVYGLLRVAIDLLVGGPAWWGGLVLGLGHRLGAARRALCADGARSQAAARLSLGREHRDHLHRDRGAAWCSRASALPTLAALGLVRRALSHDQPRLLQGAALPRRRLRAPRDGHPQHGSSWAA